MSMPFFENFAPPLTLNQLRHWKTIQKQIKKQNLQDALDVVFNDLETVGCNNDTRLDDLDDLETVDYNNDTSITDLVPIKKLETIKEEAYEEYGLHNIKTVNYPIISNDDNDVKFILKTSSILEKGLNVLAKIN